MDLWKKLFEQNPVSNLILVFVPIAFGHFHGGVDIVYLKYESLTFFENYIYAMQKNKQKQMWYQIKNKKTFHLCKFYAYEMGSAKFLYLKAF